MVIGAANGYGEGYGILWGAAAGAGFVALMAIMALVRIAYLRLLR
jgi:hypothetical protein